MVQADLGGSVVERQVVVKVVGRIRLGPLEEIEGGEEDGGDGTGGDGEVAPVLSSAHPRRMVVRVRLPVVAVTGFEPRTIELTEGSKVLVRPIVPEDEPLLHEAVAAMSERT